MSSMVACLCGSLVSLRPCRRCAGVSGSGSVMSLNNCSHQKSSAQCWAGKVPCGNLSQEGTVVRRVLGETNQPHQDGSQEDIRESPHQSGNTPNYSC